MGEVIASYRIDADNIEVAARAIAMEQSTGTWTEVTTATKEMVAKIAFPVEDFSLEIGGYSTKQITYYDEEI